MAEKLKELVDSQIQSRKPPTWHYESRVKGEESFALKMECGRADNPSEIEDTFGCVLVVPNYSALGSAEEVVNSLFGRPAVRRPRDSSETAKDPTDFRFDDLRLYMRYPASEMTPPTGVEGTLFEVQIRTFLQHAWTIATHDIVYKSDQLSWRRERIAAQAKAALEQAEVTIAMMSALEKNDVLPETSKDYRRFNNIIESLRDHWDSEQLPTNIRLLAVGVDGILRDIGLSSDDLPAILDTGRTRYGGRHNLDWSPYRAIVRYLSEQHAAKFKRCLSRKGRGHVFVYPDVLSALGLDRTEAPRATFVDDVENQPSAAKSENALL
ncbi:hypothetical protein [Longispora fulva]|uniref:PpGpp synthetase/RelA/SpoT-type nucleotidyltransferase n=1 Tax=Longispora fulva TaxID=619741 RepID=A0A8J7GKK0_9ACTN|nr:hypothetical protein [Longispora fulva]MBG6138368.1 ppGpp synthetase/RelA/SpoT-type nucleotidyltransferase [Longispora fulva]